jgi:tetratricopeptide (TPR) repeat protein
MAQSDWPAAEQVFTQAITKFPDNPVLLANYGAVLQELGKHAHAITSYERAVSVYPMYATAWFNLGTALQTTGELARAAAAFSRVLAIDPQHAGAIANLTWVSQVRGHALPTPAPTLALRESAQEGCPIVPRPLRQWLPQRPVPRSARSGQRSQNTRGEQKQFAARFDELAQIASERADYLELAALCASLLEIEPKRASAWAYLGLARLRGGDPVAALTAFSEVLALGPMPPAVLSNVGAALVELGRFELARSFYGKAIEIDAKFADAYNNRGVSFEREGKPAEAIADFDLAIALRPDFVSGLLNAGFAKQSLGQNLEAIAHYDQVLALVADHPDALYNKARSYSQLADFPQAVVWFDRVLANNPNHAQAWFGRGNAKRDLGDLAGALRDLEQAFSLEPGDAEIKFGLALLRLLVGDFRSGLALHEDRWRARSAKQMLTAVPRLGPAGDQDLDGKRIAIFSEQGLGDSIQFIRFARDLSAAGAQVTAIVHAPLVSLFRSSRLAPAVVDIDTALTPFDFACPLMSLPTLLGTDLESLARDPRYLQVDPAKTRFWQQRLGENQKSYRVGLAWSGNPKHGNDAQRSIALALLWREALEPFADQVEFFCLQKEMSAGDRTTLSQLPILDHSTEFHDFETTAALCECLDLVVSVDTSVAHLCGALGKPTLLLLPFVPDWRWLMGRADSPWYPSLTLLRQARRGDWDSVFASLCGALSVFVSSKLTRPEGFTPGNTSRPDES